MHLARLIEPLRLTKLAATEFKAQWRKLTWFFLTLRVLPSNYKIVYSIYLTPSSPALSILERLYFRLFWKIGASVVKSLDFYLHLGISRFTSIGIRLLAISSFFEGDPFDTKESRSGPQICQTEPVGVAMRSFLKFTNNSKSMYARILILRKIFKSINDYYKNKLEN